jgi:hypothetical protein
MDCVHLQVEWRAPTIQPSMPTTETVLFHRGSFGGGKTTPYLQYAAQRQDGRMPLHMPVL